MIEKILSIQDVITLCGLLFLIVKLIQRKEGWGWGINRNP